MSLKKYLPVFLLPVATMIKAQGVDDTRVLLNQIRQQSGITDHFEQDTTLDAAARRHCLYWRENYDWLKPLRKQRLINLHHQVEVVEEDWVKLVDDGGFSRVFREGYRFNVAENVALGDLGDSMAIHMLMASLGHRVKFLKAGWGDLGFHACEIQDPDPAVNNRMFVYLMGNREERIKKGILESLCSEKGTDVCPADAENCNRGIRCDNGMVVLEEWFRPEVNQQIQPQTTGVIMYPGNGAVDVIPKAHNIKDYDSEQKDERGTIISIEFLPDTLERLSGEPLITLKDGYGLPVSLQKIAAELLKDLSPGLRAWFAEESLGWLQSYTSEIRYTLVGEGDKTIVSKFTTLALEGLEVRVSDRYQQIEIEGGSVATLIFSREVFSERDLSNLQRLPSESDSCIGDCPATRSIEFVDNRLTMEFHGDVTLFSKQGNMKVVIKMK